MKPRVILVLSATVLVVIALGLWWVDPRHMVRPKQYVPSVGRGSSNSARRHDWKSSSSKTPTRQYSNAPAVVPPTIRPILGLEGDGSIGNRMRALRALGQQLTKEECEGLCEFLLSPTNPDGLDPMYTHWLKNDVMDLLVEQASQIQDVTTVLAAVYDDRQQDPVMRDYAIQHLSVCHERSSGSAEKQAIQELLWEATADDGGAIAGTALLALVRLSGVDPATPGDNATAGASGANTATPIDPQRLAETALRVASDPKVGDPVRLTALQACARMSVTEALPLARQLAQGNAGLPLRISAIAAVGALGGEEDIGFLKELATGAEKRLQPAAAAALQRLQQPVNNAVQQIGQLVK